jgi:hypothetical protein
VCGQWAAGEYAVRESRYPTEWTRRQSIRLNGGDEIETRRVLDYLPRRLWEPELVRAQSAAGPIRPVSDAALRWRHDDWLRVPMAELLRQGCWRLYVVLAPDSRNIQRNDSLAGTVAGAVLLRHGWLGRAFCLHMWAPFGQIDVDEAIKRLREMAPQAVNLVDLMQRAGVRLPTHAPVDAQGAAAN